MFWIHRILLVLLAGGLALVLLAVCTGYRLSQPMPERFHAEVQTAGPALNEALAAAPASAYLSDFEFQQSWATCGPASLRNALTSLGEPVESERALFGDADWSWWKALATGMTLDELAALARANASGRLEVEVARSATLDAFRAALRKVDEPGTRLIVNFDRAPLFGAAVGHFSPVGGYDPETGLVMLLDVTEGYGFSLVPDRILFTATRALDPVAGQPRGLLRISDPRPSSVAVGRPALARPLDWCATLSAAPQGPLSTAGDDRHAEPAPCSACIALLSINAAATA
jgi:hypothetical protein